VIREKAPGASVASPTPTPIRARNNEPKLLAPAPEQHTDRDECRPTSRIGNLSNRDAEAPIKQGEGQALEQTNPRVTDAKVTFDRPDQQTEDLTVDERQRVADHQHEEDIGRVAEARLGFGPQVWRRRRTCRSDRHGYFFSSPNKSR
jgi:hypothetical protein